MKITDKMRLDWMRKRFSRRHFEVGTYGFYVGHLGPFKTDLELIDAAIRAEKLESESHNERP